MNESQSNELDWDFYFYVGNTLLGLSMDDFWKITPAHFLKQYIMHLRYNDPEKLNPEQEIHYLDQTPYL